MGPGGGKMKVPHHFYLGLEYVNKYLNFTELVK